jgi:hypothetical protein
MKKRYFNSREYPGKKYWPCNMIKHRSGFSKQGRHTIATLVLYINIYLICMWQYQSKYWPYNTVMSRICSRTLAKNHRHNKKLGQSNDSKHEGIKKRWVINTSERSLTQHEITLLRKGMNFALAPKNVPTKEIIASVEKGINIYLTTKRMK